MNRNSYFTFRSGILSFFIFLLVFFLPACNKSSPDGPNYSKNKEVNDWVIENMREVYYWNESIPSNSKLNFNHEPQAFFKTILNKNDRFSWIDKTDDLKGNLQGISTSTGMNIDLVQGDKGMVIGYVRYVIPDSPAERAGIERGMFFTKINGREMSSENYKKVLEPYYNGKSFSVQLAELLADNAVKETEEIQLSAIKLSEPSVYTRKIITTASGRKVGYLFYNRFLNEKSHELFTVFQDFKANGVQELILDIRYNLGGGIAAAGLLSALIVQHYDEEKVFVEYSYNQTLNKYYDQKKGPDYRKHKFRDLFSGSYDSWRSKINSANLNLSKVYVLATYNSASASELVINNLRPYMNVVHIGETTRGKNEGSITIEDEREPRQIDWAIQPIVVKLANADHFGNYEKGLSPNYYKNEGFVLKAFGDKEDPLIAWALAKIDPRMEMQTQDIRKSEVWKAVEEFHKNNKAIPVLID